MIKDMKHRGFTIIELVIVITIMGILLTLGVVNMRSSQANSRDAERKADIESIALNLENYYTSGSDPRTAPVDCYSSTMTHSNGYTIHTFTTSGTLTCTSGFINSVYNNASILVVGGGGGGGGSMPGDGGGGGGGAGGYVYRDKFSLTGQTYSTVGSGGVGGSNNPGSKGSNSSFSTITAVGGGGGGSGGLPSGGWGTPNNGSDGGSGGGAGYRYSGGGYASALFGNGTALQGNAGGQNGSANGGAGGGGGGGAGGGGGDGQANHVGGLAGIGKSGDISGIPVTYSAGGGGGGADTYKTVVDAASNTGNGGPGTYGYGVTGRAGGSGIIIIKYKTPTIGNGSYPSTLFLTPPTASTSSMRQTLRDIDIKSLTAPGMTDPMTPTQTFIAATNSTQTTTGITPQPTISQYVYQPLQSDGTLCTSVTQECRKFNLFYRLESDNTVYMVTSKNQ